jgi:Rad52/22 family double-strand break repair protein
MSLADIANAPELVQPAKSLAEATHDLRRPFTVHAVQFRILEGRDGTRANCAAYIDAATAIDRLNLVVPGLWSSEFFDVGHDGRLGCRITVDGQAREDVGVSLQPGTPMGFKGMRSDALKRAAVHFGVGISLRTLPGMVLYVDAGHVKTYTGGRDGQAKPKYFMTPAGDAELRDRYARWLEATGVKAFGEPLDHGHVAGSRDAEDRPAQEDAPAVERTDDPDLPPEAFLVIEHAEQAGHAQLSNPEVVGMMVAGLTPEKLRGWAAAAHKQLDVMERHS